MVNGLAFRLMGRDADVDDLVQDAFVTAFAGLHGLDDPQAFAAWLGSIVVRTAGKVIRRRVLLERLGLRRRREPIDIDAVAARVGGPRRGGRAAPRLRAPRAAAGRAAHRVPSSPGRRHGARRNRAHDGNLAGDGEAANRRGAAGGRAMGGSGATMSGNDFKNLVPLITESRLARQYAAIRERVPAAPPRRRFGAAGWVVAAGLRGVALVVVLLRTAWRAQRRARGRRDRRVGAGGRRRAAPPRHAGRRLAGRPRRRDARPADERAARRPSASISSEGPSRSRRPTSRAGPSSSAPAPTRCTSSEPTSPCSATRASRSPCASIAAPSKWRRWRAREARRAGSRRASSGPRRMVARPAPRAAGDRAGDSAAAAPPWRSSRRRAPRRSGARSRAGERPRTRHDESAKELFDEAQRARADGRPYDAARAFDRLRRTYPARPSRGPLRVRARAPAPRRPGRPARRRGGSARRDRARPVVAVP